MQIFIQTQYITLQQALKLSDVVSSGGMVKLFLQEETVLVNGEKETRRGRKLFPGDLIQVQENLIEILMRENEN